MTARIGVVVLHYGTDDLTLRSLRALLADDGSPARRVVLVDNGPGPGVADRVRAELPDVEVVVPGTNTGFAGGCNRGIAALGPDVELVALVNSDVLVAPGWLTPLVAALDADPRLGAVVPKTRFEGRFHDLLIETADTWRPGRGDGRQLAWQPRAVEVDGVDVTDRCQLVDGFWEPGRGGRWAAARAVLRVPEVAGATSARLRLATPPGRDVDLTVNGDAVRAGHGETVIDLPLGDGAVVVIANAGNERRGDGYGLDLGRFEVDRGQRDEAVDVPAWCGGAVLLRGSYLRDVGAFDERLFLYYEDLELALRGRDRGWRYRYEPASVVEHRVGSSTVGGGAEARAERRKERNRLLVLARHPSPSTSLAAQLVRFVAVTLAYVRREIVAPPLRGAPPCGWLLKVRGLAFLEALPRLPGQWASGRRDRRRARESRAFPNC